MSGPSQGVSSTRVPRLGSAATDRNLYVNAIDINGAPVSGDTVDPHYVGKALDYRAVALGIPDAIITAIKAAIQAALGAQYVVAARRHP